MATDDLRRFLDALYGRSRPQLLVELRVRADVGMAQRFLPVDRLDAVELLVRELTPQTDVYIGVLPRWRAGGTRRDVAAGGGVVWADCDGDEAVETLAHFRAAPSVLVQSGSGENRHAYWLLERQVSVADVERANRRLAFALGADGASADAARILRPPESRNHKAVPPTRVRLERCEPDQRHALHQVVCGLPEPPIERRSRGRRSTSGADPLLDVDPAFYVQRLTGHVVGRSRKVRCPLHDDRVPSLHVYPDPERGWYCFGCRRGGSVYDLAALLWRRPARGPAFAALRRDLERLLA
jgi:hypothetical protein